MSSHAADAIVALRRTTSLHDNPGQETTVTTRLPDAETFPVRRLNIRVPSVRGFQQQYESAGPPAPLDKICELVHRHAPWSDMNALVRRSGPHRFLGSFT